MTDFHFIVIIACIVLLWYREARNMALKGRGWMFNNVIVGFCAALFIGWFLALLLHGEFNGWTIIGWVVAAGIILHPVIQALGQPGADKAADEPASAAPPPQALASIADIEFDYRDAQGVESRRRVEVEAVDGEYFQGHCHKAGAERTFVIGRVRGRVLDLDSGELLAPKAWAAEARAHPLNDPDKISIRRDREENFTDLDDQASDIEICFTGFSKADKLRLEDMARDGGMIVRQSVTSRLTHLCAGAKPGLSKLDKAVDVGAELIDEAEFYALYASA